MLQQKYAIIIINSVTFTSQRLGNLIFYSKIYLFTKHLENASISCRMEFEL